jgi:hypothetical protein
VTDPVSRLVGDGRWWARPNCLSHPQARSFVDDLDGVVAELRALYPAEVVLELVARGDSSRIIGLFFDDGWCDEVDEVLQLGHDLRQCGGWDADAKLVADLRANDSYPAARFDVGVWAGLTRVGLKPEREPAEDRAARRADFRVMDGAHRVAIELKSLADPQRARNIRLLDFHISMAVTRYFPEHVGSVILEPSDDLDAALDETFDNFHARLDSAIWPALAPHLHKPLEIGRYTVAGVGTLTVTGKDEGDAGRGIGVITDDEWTVEYAARRVLGRVVSARRQLVATDADFRAAVIWGGRHHVPCRAVIDEIDRKSHHGFDLGAVDYVVVLNSHRSGPHPGWTTEAAILATRSDVPLPATLTWPRGLIAWKRLH